VRVIQHALYGGPVVTACLAAVPGAVGQVVALATVYPWWAVNWSMPAAWFAVSWPSVLTLNQIAAFTGPVAPVTVLIN
jgi:hypothetical protein